MKVAQGLYAEKRLNIMNFIKGVTMLPRMRTIEQCVNLVKELDEHTAISEWFIRCLVRDNKIFYVNTGKKILVNFDSFLNYLNAIAS